MLPWPLAAIPGASAATRTNGARTLLANILSNVSTSNSAVGPKAEIPALFDQDVDVADVARQSLHVADIGEVGSDEAGPAASGSDLLDCLGPTSGVAPVNKDLGAVAGQLQRDRATDTRRRAGHQRPLPFEIVSDGR